MKGSTQGIITLITQEVLKLTMKFDSIYGIFKTITKCRVNKILIIQDY